MGTWYQRLRGHVPDAAVVREIVEQVEQLPGLDRWSPPQGLENLWPQIIRWGCALWMTRSLGGLEPVHKAMAAEILAGRGPAPDSFAELSAAAVCVGLGATAGRRIPRSGGKTPDWRMEWPPRVAVDLEVAVARRKDKHVERERLATDLAVALFRADRDFDLLVDLADPTVATDRDAILALAKTIATGQDRGVPGSWQLSAREITRPPKVLITGGADSRPPWWSVDDARCFVLHGQLAGPDTRRAPPQVRVSFGVPYDSYINPIRRKADSPQGTTGLPFLVALDVSNLPAAFTEMPRALQGFLPLWKTVSGILLFEALIYGDRVGWLWRLIKNPHSAVPLPDALCLGRADLPHTMETGVRLAKEDEEPRGAA